MAFDMGFDFRATLAGPGGFSADPVYAVPVLGESYPNTYTNSNGDTINAGWTFSGFNTVEDRNGTIDPRLAGTNFQVNSSGTSTFQIDLGSGSAPGAGNYSSELALGDASSQNSQALVIKDTAATLLSIPRTDTALQHWLDATFADYGYIEWPTSETPVSLSFSTATCTLTIGANDGGGFATTIAHFRLTFVSAGGAGGAGACECSYFHSFEYREVSDFMDCVVGRRS